MSRSAFAKDNGIEHLSQKEKACVRSFKYRLMNIIQEKKEFKHLSEADMFRLCLFADALESCKNDKLKTWKEQVKVCKKSIKKHYTPKMLRQKSRAVFIEFNKAIKEGLGGISKSRTLRR